MSSAKQSKARLLVIALAVAIAGAGTAGAGSAAAQGSGEAACPGYAVDIAAYAACGATRAAADIEVLYFVAPRQAWDMKAAEGSNALLIDVRDPIEVEAAGVMPGVDAIVPWAQLVQPLEWDSEAANPRMEVNRHFVAQLQARIATHDGDRHTPLLLVCRDSMRAQMAAVALHAAGHDQVMVVWGGIDGHADGGGGRQGGWKPAGLPWLARAAPALLQSTAR